MLLAIWSQGRDGYGEVHEYENNRIRYLDNDEI